MNMIHSRMIPIACTTILAALALTMSGCLIQSAKSTKITGAYVAPDTVSQVDVNQSTQDDVELIMGQPSSRTTHDDGTETWTWNWKKTKGDGGTVFLIFAGASKETIDQSVHIKFRDGVVIKKWRD